MQPIHWAFSIVGLPLDLIICLKCSINYLMPELLRMFGILHPQDHSIRIGNHESDNVKLACSFVTSINSSRFWKASCLRYSTLCRMSPDLV